jgi:hypothetical protein
MDRFSTLAARIALLTAAAPAIASASLRAQLVTPQPARQLAAFAPLVGTWKGSGVMRQDPARPGARWSSHTSYRWVLGGHFLREDARVEIDGAPAAVQFTAFYGYDRETRRLMSYTVDSLGALEAVEVHWVDDNTMVTASGRVEAGIPAINRWVTRLQGTRMSLTGHTAVGAGDFFARVEGTATRTSKDAEPVHLAEDGPVPATAGTTARMQPLESLCGDYGFTGWTVPAPGQARVAIRGAESVRPVFGGAILRFRQREEATRERPGRRERESYLAWDGQDACYRMVTLTDAGTVEVAACRAAGASKLILTSARTQGGQPAVARGVVELDDEGAMTGIQVDRILSDGVLERVLELHHEKEKS